MPRDQLLAALTAALLTPAGRGAVAVIRVRGAIDLLDEAIAPHFSAANGKTLSEQPLQAIRFGHWGDSITEEVVVCRTDEATCEINCHGGTAAVNRILNDLAHRGVQTTTWQQQVSQSSDWLTAECVTAITRATTRRTALRLVEQRDLWMDVAKRWQVDIESPSATALSEETRTAIERCLSWAEFGRHLIEPWRVAICGRPNVGKSTLINALLGYDRAIVFDQPGTTRDVLTGETALAGWPILFADTAGLRETPDELEQAGIERARRALADADVRLVVFDQSQLLTTDDIDLLTEATKLPRTLVIANKSDLETQSTWPNSLAVSAAERVGLEALADRLIAELIPNEPAPDEVIPVTAQQASWLQGLLAQQ